MIALTALLPGPASAAAPLATTKAATEVAKESAKLNGLVNPTGTATGYWFEYGTSNKYGTKTALTGVGSQNGNVEVNNVVTGLPKSTLYHFRIVAQNVFGKAVGADETFNTLPVRVVTEPATEVLGKAATLNGKGNAEGAKVTVYFEYGTTEAYGSKTSEQSLGGTELKPFQAMLKSLPPGTTYHFRAVIVTTEGTKVGVDRTFATPAHSWFVQSTPNPVTHDALEAVSCISGSECIAVGDEPIALSWNGSSWSAMTIPSPGGITELDSVSCSSFSACTAVGLHWNTFTTYVPLAERWNGSEWKIQEVPTPTGSLQSTLHGVQCTSSTACTAVGNYLAAKEEWLPFAAVWNGSEWKLQEMAVPVGHSLNYVYDLSCSSASACTAVGYTSGEFLAERWNGTEWKVQTTPTLGGTWEGVSCPTATFCLAAGMVNHSEPRLPYAASWNGTEWKTLSPLKPSEAVAGLFFDVSCSSATACSVVGRWNNGSSGFGLVEGWDGSTWQYQAVEPPSGSTTWHLGGVSCLSSVLCEAVGSYGANPPLETLAERFE